MGINVLESEQNSYLISPTPKKELLDTNVFFCFDVTF